MWTEEEIEEIRDRAELEADNPKHNILWRNACVDMASSASRIIDITARICDGKITALKDNKGKVKLPHPSED